MKNWILILVLSLASTGSLYAKGPKKTQQDTASAGTSSNWQFGSKFNNGVGDFDYVGEVMEGSLVSVIKDGSNQRLLCDASVKQDGSVGKAYVSKNFPDIFNGDTIELSATYYVNEYLKDGKIYLMDLECRDCGWDSKPGIRMYMSEDGLLGINRGKLGSGLKDFKTLFQVPLRRYFNVKVSYRLGDEQTGLTTIWVNRKLITREAGVNMPLKSTFLETKGVTLTAEKFTYVQFGVTANSSISKRAEVQVDDVAINIIRGQ